MPPTQPVNDTRHLINRIDVELALESAGLGLWEVDPATAQITWDDRCQALFGLNKDNQLPYQQAIQYIHPQDVERVKQAVKWAMNPASDGVYDQTYRTLGADDGQLRWVRFFGRSSFTPDGQLIRFAGAAQEVTQAVLAQQTIQEKEARFRSLVEEAPVATCLYVGPDFVIELANEAMIRFFGKGPTIVGRPISQVLTDSAADQAALALLKQAWTTDAVYTASAAPAQLTLDGRQGTYYFDFTLKPLRNTAGAVYAILQTAVDVTHRELAQQQRQQLEARQQLLLTLTDQLRSLADAAQMQYQAATLLGRYLGANRVGFAEDQQDGQTIVVTQNYLDGVPSLAGRYHYDDYGPALLTSFRAGQRVIRPDIQSDPSLTAAEKQAHAALKLGATLNIPMLTNNQLVLVLFVHFQQAHHWTDEELEVCADVAERTWLAIERARAEAALKESEQRFRLLADALPQAIWMTDAMGNTEFMNQWWTDYSGIAYEPSTAWQVAATSVHPEDAPRLIATFQQAIQEEKGFSMEQRNRSASGEYRWFLNVGEPYRDPKTGQITRWVGMSIDIDERKRAQQALTDSEHRYRSLAAELDKRVQTRTQELQQANQDLTRSNENLQQFAYVASHDLQEPLRKIQSFSTLLAQELDEQLTESSRSYLQRITAAGSRMSMLIKDLLAYSRIATRQQTFGPVSLHAIVAGVLATLDWDIQQTGAQIEVDELPVINGDESQLGQLFQNLLTNAMKFVVPKQPPRIHIEYVQCSSSDLPAEVRPNAQSAFYHQINVVDQGVGFDEKFRDRIFQVFQRLHGKNEYPGSGVGLAICQRVVENHGGGITARSEPGHGAAFSVYLPA